MHFTFSPKKIKATLSHYYLEVLHDSVYMDSFTMMMAKVLALAYKKKGLVKILMILKIISGSHNATLKCAIHEWEWS